MRRPAESLEDLLDELSRSGEGDSVSVGEVVDGDGVLVLLGYGLSALTIYLLVTAISAGPW